VPLFPSSAAHGASLVTFFFCSGGIWGTILLHCGLLDPHDRDLFFLQSLSPLFPEPFFSRLFELLGSNLMAQLIFVFRLPRHGLGAFSTFSSPPFACGLPLFVVNLGIKRSKAFFRDAGRARLTLFFPPPFSIVYLPRLYRMVSNNPLRLTLSSHLFPRLN